MKKIIQESITLTDPKAIKIMEKVLPKKIIHCLNESPLTASEIAHAVSFPKDKIYYHIKNLLSYDILFVATTEIVRGIKQNKYSPVAKTINYNNKILQIGSDDFKKNVKPENIKKPKLKGIHKNNKTEKRKSQFQNDSKFNVPLEDPRKPRLFQNALMHLNGVTHSMTFVHTGNRVMFLYADLGFNRIKVKSLINYSLPIKKGKTTINTLTDLIISVFDQFIDQMDKEKIYLAIHSESYEYCMAYIDPDKIKNFSRRNKTIDNISKFLNIDGKENIIDYQTFNNDRNKSVICHSNSKALIRQDYHKLIKAGIQPRYNTSIPKILFNFYNYCRDKDDDNGEVLLLYIDYNKTHLALVHNYCLVDSKEFTSGLNDFISELKALTPKTKQSLVSVRVKALDYLERYGIANSNDQLNKLNILPFKKSQNAIQELSKGIVSKIKNSFSQFSKYIDKDKTPASMITKIYICGPGSHIRNLNELISSSIGKPVDLLSNFDSISIEKATIQDSKSSPRKNDDGIIDKISESEENLEMVRGRIDRHKQAIATVTPQDSDAYSLTRLEIEKDSKFKKIEKAQKELIHTATEFKCFRDNYDSNQEKLSSNLENTFNQLGELNATLDQKSQEREYIVKTISSMEFDKDFIQGSVEIGKIENTNDETLKIKKLSYLRSKLMRDKESLEHEIINQEKSILIIRQNNQDALLEVETIYDEIGVMEYLLQNIQNAKSLFPKASLSKLRLYHNLQQMDLDYLENVWFQFSFDVDRMEELKNTLSEQTYIYGSHAKNHQMNQNDEIELREILLPVIDELLDASENMLQIKKIMAMLIDMSDSQRDLVKKRILKENLLKEKKMLKDKQEIKLSKIQKKIGGPNINVKK